MDVASSCKKVKIPEWISYEQIENELILLNTVDWNYYRLDVYGTVVWKKLIDYGGDVNALKKWVLEHFEGNPFQIQNDIDCLIKALIEKNLLVIDQGQQKDPLA
ncbi:pyrroloquinoline quinone biosynthesis protein PqqD [Methylacidiphilum kamchatkense Kam1]|nr:PqqD family protein [Methylacidiphilum kamchatkense]KIE58715.1 pyrroloquinoline quinone biosynthesis protein PqqD [Methylacidiphilum kamchatkense Kam1]